MNERDPPGQNELASVFACVYVLSGGLVHVAWRWAARAARRRDAR